MKKIFFFLIPLIAIQTINCMIDEEETTQQRLERENKYRAHEKFLDYMLWKNTSNCPDLSKLCKNIGKGVLNIFCCGKSNIDELNNNIKDLSFENKLLKQIVYGNSQFKPKKDEITYNKIYNATENPTQLDERLNDITIPDNDLKNENLLKEHTEDGIFFANLTKRMRHLKQD